MTKPLWKTTSATLGTTRTGRQVRVPHDSRKRHMHVIGDSGKGKSKLLESMIREDIRNGQGVCVLDPHGSLYDNVVTWLSANPLLSRHRRIHLIDPGGDGAQVGFNPFFPRDDTTTMGRVDAFATALAKVFCGADLTQTPLIKERLELIGYALDTNGLSPNEASYLTTPDLAPFRQLLTRNIENTTMRNAWRAVNAERPRDMAQNMAPITRRMLGLLGSPVMADIFGQDRSLDLRKCMEEGHVVLVKLLPSGGDFTSQAARILGTLLLRFLYMTALNREAETSRPFYVYVDEAYEFLTDDIEKFLVGMRKFGCHLVLAHHYLEQLRSAGDHIYAGVMHGAPTKVVFGLNYEDGVDLIDRLFPERIRADRINHALDRPTAVGSELVILEGGGSSYSDGVSTNPSVSTSGETAHYDAEGEVVSRSEHWSSASPQQPTYSHSHSASSGWQEAYRTKYEVLGTATYGIEDLRHIEAVKVMSQADRRAVVKVPGRRAAHITTPEVKQAFARTSRIDAYVAATLDTDEFAASRDKAREEIDHREMHLLASVKREHVGGIAEHNDDETPQLSHWGKWE